MNARAALPQAIEVRWAAAAALLLGAGLVAVELVLRSENGLRGQIIGQEVAFAVYLPAAWLCWRGLGVGVRGLLLVLAIGIVLQAVAFARTAPPLSNDPYRYTWDARVQAHEVNPYRFPPAAAALAGLRDRAIWPRLDKRNWRTIYPPGAEASFLAARGLFGGGVRATTWLFLLAEAAAIGLLIAVLRRLRAPTERIALVAWHPLAASEIAANGHSDSLLVLALAALLFAWSGGRRGLAGTAVAYGALVKLAPLLMLPALARRGRRRFVLTGAIVVAAGYAAYLSVGMRVLESLLRDLRAEDLGSLAWARLEPLVGAGAARAQLAAALLATIAIVALREHESVEQVARSGLLVLGGTLLALSYLQPWYGLWLLPFFAIVAAPAWLWLSGTLPLLYVYGLAPGPLPSWVRAVIYGPFVALTLLRLVRPPHVAQAASLPRLPARPTVAAVIPALNEAAALPKLLAEFDEGAVDEVIVVDGGSTDGTVEAARACGARVIIERRRGYGRACLSGAEASDADLIVFLDGDGSDDPKAIPRLLSPILAGPAALSLGSRANPEPGALHRHQQLGNGFVSWLVRRIYGLPIRDIPPMRAVRHDVLVGLALQELTYGWPTEMVVKAARAGLPIVELPVPSRPRGAGESKISGRLGPSLRAGARMLAVIARHV